MREEDKQRDALKKAKEAEIADMMRKHKARIDADDAQRCVLRKGVDRLTTEK